MTAVAWPKDPESNDAQDRPLDILVCAPRLFEDSKRVNVLAGPRLASQSALQNYKESSNTDVVLQQLLGRLGVRVIPRLQTICAWRVEW